MSSISLTYESYQPYIRIFEIVTNIITIATLIMSFISIKIIFTKTSNILKNYRRLLIILIIVQQINCIHFLLFKTIYLLPTDAILVKATFSISGPFVIFLSPIMETMMIVVIADLLLCMFIERYYAMTSGVIHHGMVSERMIFSGIGITAFMLFFSYIFALIFGGHLFNFEESRKYIYENFNSLEAIVNLPNFGVTDIFSNFSISTGFFEFFVCLFMSTRIFGYLFYTHKIIYCLKACRSQTNNFASQIHNINAVKTLLIQLLTLLIFGCIPVTIIVIFYVFKFNSTFKFYIFLQCMYHFYFLIDMICIVVLIRPYRRALFQFIFKFTKRKDFSFIASKVIPSAASNASAM